MYEYAGDTPRSGIVAGWNSWRGRHSQNGRQGRALPPCPEPISWRLVGGSHVADGPPGRSGLPEFGSKADAGAGIVVFDVCIMHDSVFRICIERI